MNLVVQMRLMVNILYVPNVEVTHLMAYLTAFVIIHLLNVTYVDGHRVTVVVNS